MPIAGVTVTSSTPSPYNYIATGAPATDVQKMQAPPLPSAWEEMEYGGLNLNLSEAPGLSEGLIVKNTFLALPNLRSPSLDEYYAEKDGCKSCPAPFAVAAEGFVCPAPLQILESKQHRFPSEMQSFVIAEQEAEAECASNLGSEEASKEDESELKELGNLPSGVVVRNTFIDLPNFRSTSLDEYMQDKGWKSCPVSRMQSEAENQISEIQAAVIRETAESVFSGSDEREESEEEEQPTTLRLLDHLPRPAPVFSVGSMPHQLGQQCKPCGFVHKPEGCSNGANCQYCHLCPPGTIKQRKKVKKVMIRQFVNQRRSGGWY